MTLRIELTSRLTLSSSPSEQRVSLRAANLYSHILASQTVSTTRGRSESGFRIEEADAMSYVWGYTIINDMRRENASETTSSSILGNLQTHFAPWLVNSYINSLHLLLTLTIGPNCRPRRQASQYTSSSDACKRPRTTERNDRRPHILHSFPDQGTF
jgi:hypothetical protein